MDEKTKKGKRTSPTCLYCPKIDDAEHSLFSCPRWSREKQELELYLGGEVNVGNLVEYMLSKAEAWERIQMYMRNIMKKKRGVWKKRVNVNVDLPMKNRNGSGRPRRKGDGF
ncbi:hypothetical protein Zmor_007567 [Zophobas morio]|uniref:Reverse transcriptase zinc-binding domain-containing protein n=1 Tax=Zophobas morio TaxID=2755281 RepID=A0AA38MPF9_9CUCU|nr:hypothetical protein Zmor_007567 [Zophobas morio]